jgi:hypothetical protein
MISLLPVSVLSRIFQLNRMQAAFARMRRLVAVRKFRSIVLPELHSLVDEACDDFLLAWMTSNFAWDSHVETNPSEIPYLLAIIRRRNRIVPQ